jgi:hypothetical protein
VCGRPVEVTMRGRRVLLGRGVIVVDSRVVHSICAKP